MIFESAALKMAAEVFPLATLVSTTEVETVEGKNAEIQEAVPKAGRLAGPEHLTGYVPAQANQWENDKSKSLNDQVERPVSETGFHPLNRHLQALDKENQCYACVVQDVRMEPSSLGAGRRKEEGEEDSQQHPQDESVSFNRRPEIRSAGKPVPRIAAIHPRISRAHKRRRLSHTTEKAWPSSFWSNSRNAAKSHHAPFLPTVNT
jgi:hypothetical protein